jgi:succinyl-diaminopimelate desuccinylase
VTDLAERLARRTLELVDVPSESRDEAALHAHVHDVWRAGGIDVRDAGDTCLLAGVTDRRDRPLVLLAGHLDTVPAQGNRPGRIEDGVVHGLGAADMKGADAVIVELALHPPPQAAVDLGFVLFGREELPFGDSALTPLLEREPGLRTADLVVVMEPTAGRVQAGCLGNLNATWTFRGRTGHSARPWLADNAIERLAEGVRALAALEPVEHEHAGLTFTEVVSVVQVHGGIARNVVPGEATAYVNYRYPPGIAAEAAEARLRGWCEPHGEVVIEGNAPSGAVADPDAPLVARLREAAGGDPVEPKQAWTPVAEFAAVGVDAVNFGPGEPRFAHTADEQVDVARLVHAHDALVALACSP